MIKNWTVGRPGNEARYTDAQNKGDGHLASRHVGSGRGGGLLTRKASNVLLVEQYLPDPLLLYHIVSDRKLGWVWEQS